jgi:DNA-binding MarR family transcriptional regulator
VADELAHVGEQLPRRQDAVKRGPASSHTPAGETFDALAQQMIQLTRLFTAAGERLTRPAGQTLARWLVLAEVKEGPATVAEIARRLRLARQSVQRIADLLEHDGLAAYEDNPRHRRAKLLRLTPDGHATLRAIEIKQRAWADALGAKIGEANIHEALRILQTVLEAVEHAEDCS